MSRDRNFKDRMPREKKHQSVLQRKRKQYDTAGGGTDRFGLLLSSLGNEQVSRLVEGGGIQAKLDMSTPGDFYEQQADKIAEQMVQMKPGDGASGLKIDKLQTKGGSGGTVPSGVETGINQLKGKGNSMSRPLRDFFEPRLGVDLGNVRIHTDSNANCLARSVNARAFTYQNEIVFGKGEYQPNSTEGKRLIGHELVHTVQQDTKIHRKPDLPDSRASDEFYQLLQGIENDTKFPIYSMILASPTLRPYAVEQAANAGVLGNTKQHPGTTFKGTVGEAYVLYRLLYAGNEGNAWLTDMFNFVFPQPITLLEEGINTVLGDYSLESYSQLFDLLDGYQPDLLLIRLGGELDINTGVIDTRITVAPTLSNAITQDNTLVHHHDLGGETCICLYEITTSWSWSHLEKRALDVANWAELSGQVSDLIPIYSILAIDRGAYFNLLNTDPEKAERLVDVVTSKGGIIQLFSDLAKESGQRARDLITQIQNL